MSSRYLGETFDIHGGGKDLIFPHHENELAQSMAVSGKPLARYWVHNGFVTIQGEKMSKSLGNFLTVQDMVRRFHPEVIRFFLLSRHYRSPLDYSEPAMQEARAGLKRIYRLLLDLEKPDERPQSKGQQALTKDIIEQAEGALQSFQKRFLESLEDDLNTAQAIGHMHELTTQLNRFMDTVKPGEMRKMAGFFPRAAGQITSRGNLLGLLEQSPETYLSQERERQVGEKGLAVEAVEALIAERQKARQEKDWPRADALRDQLRGMHIEIKDTPRGTLWEVLE
jgi:cysteinyl-tRNA synthetase